MHFATCYIEISLQIPKIFDGYIERMQVFGVETIFKRENSIMFVVSYKSVVATEAAAAAHGSSVYEWGGVSIFSVL